MSDHKEYHDHPPEHHEHYEHQVIQLGYKIFAAILRIERRLNIMGEDLKDATERLSSAEDRLEHDMEVERQQHEADSQQISALTAERDNLKQQLADAQAGMVDPSVIDGLAQRIETIDSELEARQTAATGSTSGDSSTPASGTSPASPGSGTPAVGDGSDTVAPPVESVPLDTSAAESTPDSASPDLIP